MSDFSSVDDLLEGDVINEEDVTLPNGKKIRVKGLSAFERKLVYKNAVNDGQVDIALVETRLLRYGIVQPKLSMDQAEKWMAVSLSGTIDVVTEKIRTLSGMGEGAEKSKVQ